VYGLGAWMETLNPRCTVHCLLWLVRCNVTMRPIGRHRRKIRTDPENPGARSNRIAVAKISAGGNGVNDSTGSIYGVVPARMQTGQGLAGDGIACRISRKEVRETFTTGDGPELRPLMGLVRDRPEGG